MEAKSKSRGHSVAAHQIKKFVTLESPNSWKMLLYPGQWILLVLTIVPTLYTVWLSLQSYNLAKVNQKSFVFLQNFIDVIRDPRFWADFGVTAKFCILSLILEVILGMLLAMSLSKKIFAKGFVQIIIILPMIMTPVVIGLIWKMFYDAEFGMLSYYFNLLFGSKLNMLGSSSTSLWGLIIVDVWEWTPFVTLILLSGIQSLPTAPYEAALVDGASGFQTFRYITLPLLQPAIAVAVVFRFMELFKWMDTIYIMTGGGPGTSTETLNYYTYMNNFKFLEVGYASALCIVMLICVLLICNTIGKKMLLKENH